MNSERTELKEIKKNTTGTGLLIENDGHICLSDTPNNKKIYEAYNSGSGWQVPNPFIVDAVFQKFDIKNANGRIYPEDVLKKQVAEYQQKIDEHRAYGECYRPSALVLTEVGWKPLSEVNEGDKVLTLNVENGTIEVQSVTRKIAHQHDGKLIHIKGRSIDTYVTPEHQIVLNDRNGKYKGAFTANELMGGNVSDLNHSFVPRTGNWTATGDDFFVLKGIEEPSERMLRNHPNCKDDYKIKMSTFMKFMGIYLSEGDYRKNNNDVNIYQKKESVIELIEEMCAELGLPYTVNVDKNGRHTFRINDPRLNKYVSQFGDCYTKYIPVDLKNQSKENLTILYNWFVLGDGRVRGDKRRKSGRLSDDVFSVSKQLVMDLNEIQLKIGYCGNYHTEARDNDRYIGDRLIEGNNCKEMHFTLRSLTKGVYADKRFIQYEEVPYSGEVQCIEVPNHIWYVMENGFPYWTHNCNHPSESTIDLGRISHNIIELHWVGHTLVGKMELNISEGYRRSGICSTLGDTAANLLLNGYKIGVSSRGVGSVEQKLGQYIVGDDFELICWDLVSDPSTPNAWLGRDQDELQPYIESDQTTSSKNSLNEKISKIKGLL